MIFDTEGRLRSGWRLGIFLVTFIFASAVTVSSGLALLNSIFEPRDAQSIAFFTNSLLMLIVALVIGWLCGKFLEGLPFRALGAWFTRGWFRNLLVGLAVGSATVSLAVLIAVIFGGLGFDRNPVDGNSLARSLAVSLAIFGAGAAFEEALFRGYMLQTLSRSGLAWLGITLTSGFFAIVHLGNPNATWISTVDTIIAGIWFGIAYLKTRDLWFVFGLHLMWNWVLGAIFGIEVSGLTTLVAAPLLREIDAGPEWLTGGTYGIEGGIASTIALVVSTAAIYFAPWPKASEEMVNRES